MATETSLSVHVSRVIRASREDVFRAWTKPELIRKWSCPEDARVLDSQVDLTVGGRYRLAMRTSDGTEHTAFGVYREIDPPKRLVYTWDWEGDDHSVGETVVTVDFNELGDSTEVVIHHEPFPTVEARDGHAEGWTSCLVNLEKMFDAA